jgi:hypothetical protein
MDNATPRTSSAPCQPMSWFFRVCRAPRRRHAARATLRKDRAVTCFISAGGFKAMNPIHPLGWGFKRIAPMARIGMQFKSMVSVRSVVDDCLGPQLRLSRRDRSRARAAALRFCDRLPRRNRLRYLI